MTDGDRPRGGIDAKLLDVARQYDELQAELSKPEVSTDPGALRRLGKELSEHGARRSKEQNDVHRADDPGSDGRSVGERIELAGETDRGIHEEDAPALLDAELARNRRLFDGPHLIGTGLEPLAQSRKGASWSAPGAIQCLA